MLTGLGEAGMKAFTIMDIAGQSSVTVSQRYVHPSPESLERAFERLETLNSKGSNQGGGEVPTGFTTPGETASSENSVNIS